jgi:CelD/BcsL family acetyltransferase involved in cellulose biosynthesis
VRYNQRPAPYYSQKPPQSALLRPGETLMSEWSIEWLTDWSDVWSPIFVEKWKWAFAEDTHPLASQFNHPSVVKPWCLSRPTYEYLEPRFMVATHPQGYWAMMPFVFERPRWQKGFLTEIAPVGAIHFDYQDPIIAPNPKDVAVEESFWKAVKSSAVLHPGKEADSVSWPRSRRAKQFMDWSLAPGRAPFLDLQKYSDYEDYFVSRKKSLRDDVKRRTKRINALGTCRYESLESVGEETAIEWAQSLNRFQIQRYGGGPRLTYLEHLVREYFRSGGPLRMSALYIGDRSISWHIGFQLHAKQCPYIWSFDTEFSDVAPGKIHVNLAIKDAYEKSQEVFDFGMGLENYKLGWTDGEQYEAVGFSSESLSQVAVAKRHMINIAKRARNLYRNAKNLPPAVLR